MVHRRLFLRQLAAGLAGLGATVALAAAPAAAEPDATPLIRDVAAQRKKRRRIRKKKKGRVKKVSAPTS